MKKLATFGYDVDVFFSRKFKQITQKWPFTARSNILWWLWNLKFHNINRWFDPLR